MSTYKIQLLVAVLFWAVGVQAQTPSCPPASVSFCDVTPNDPLFWNESYWLFPLINLQDIPESAQNLEISLTDAAITDIQYELFMNLDANVDKETVVSSSNLPPSNTVMYNNASTPGYSGGTPRAFDERPVPAAGKYGFALEKIVSGATITARLRWNTQFEPNNYLLPQLPYGAHRIEWIVSYSNGSTQRCVQDFVVTDCKKPTVVCLNGLTANIMQTGLIDLWAADFLQYTEDNVTPTGQLQIAIIRAEESAGVFPLDGNGEPQTRVQFDCSDTDPDFELVQLWSRDLHGNADFCEVYVSITDGFNQCQFDTVAWAEVKLRRWCDNAFVKDVVVNLNNLPYIIPPVYTTDAQGFLQSVIYPINSNMVSSGVVTVTPVKEDDALNGVDIRDIQAISRHILAVAPLPAYGMIAADVNQSGSITSFDLVEIRKLIVGQYNNFPSNTSWRFVDAFFNFPNPNNPFQTLFPATTNGVVTAPDSVLYDFIAIKVGDVTCDGIPGLQNPAPEDRNAPYAFEYEDALLQAGETREITLRFAEATNWSALQMSLGLDPSMAVWEAWDSDLPASEMTLYSPDQHVLNLVWSSVSDRRFAVGENFLRLRLRALAPMRLSNALRLDQSRIQSFALNGLNESQLLNLAAKNADPSALAPYVAPNPVAEGNDAIVRYQTAAPETVQLNLFDAAGRLCFRQVLQLESGAHQLRIPAAAMPQSGVYFWQMNAYSGTLLRQ